jgi:protein SCO1/2
MKKLSESQSLALSIISTVLAVVGFGLILSFSPEWINPPRPTPTPGGIPTSRFRERIEPVAMINQDGEPVSLANLRGKPTLLAFGYSSCPDVCPLTLADFKKVKARLGPDGERINFAMIFVDPARDTPAILKPYLAAFDASFVGLTGDKAAIDKTVAEFDASYQIESPRPGFEGYLVAHTSFIYALDADGVWRLSFPFQTSADVISADLRKLIVE